MNCFLRGIAISLLLVFLREPLPLRAAETGVARNTHPELATRFLALMKSRCGKCHGPVRPKAGLMLMTLGGVVHGSEDGAVVVPGNVDESSLWQRVADEEMPPDEPLPPEERERIRAWIEAGAPGLSDASSENLEHWAFRRLQQVDPPRVAVEDRVKTPIDRFVLAKLDENKLELNPEADRWTLIRRVSFDLTGLPPTPEEVERYLSDQDDGAYERMVETYLASPRYGERWGSHWLDTAGYADSNGYFGADTDRPLAWRYRDYVIRAYNADMPFDQFVREQLSGDELAELEGYHPSGEVTPRIIELLEATHFLRNAPDGTDSSDGNPDEVLTDKYKAIEGTLQIIGSSLLGLKLQCARCHEHKFEPIEHREYYQLQAILSPALNVDNWIKPKDRMVVAASASTIAAWEAETAVIDEKIVELKRQFSQWVREHRPRGVVVFEDAFGDLAHWSNTAPGDPSPAGTPAVQVGSTNPPAAAVEDGTLRIIESASSGDRAVCTSQAFDWTPNEKDAWIQATFDLVADSVDGSSPAARIGYFIAMHDWNDLENVGGNILFDGNPAGGAPVHLDYPGSDIQSAGTIGTTGYAPGHSFGVRVTNVGDNKFRLEQIVDGAAEEKSITLSAADLPDGGFGFEYCCGRSFIVDNVVVEASDPSLDPAPREAYSEKIEAMRKQHREAIDELNAGRTDKPGQIAWVADVSPDPPEVCRLDRGDYRSRAEAVVPRGLEVLSEESNPFDVESAAAKLNRSTGRRLALARWLTRPNSKAAALLARVTVNRVWQHHFGTGIVATADNLGYSGSPPSHRELLDWLATEFVGENREMEKWSMKRLHRWILHSAVYRQSSVPHAEGSKLDPDNRLLWRFRLRRLDADAIRDAMLAASGELDPRAGGPYVPTKRLNASEVIVDEKTNGARRRSVYLQHRRTQLPNILEVFDAPSIVFNCTLRDSTTVPLQSLNLLNSEFCRNRAMALASRLRREAGAASDARETRVFLLVLGRQGTDDEIAASRAFLEQQPAQYAGQEDAEQRAWIDFCQMLLASNAFLYVE